MPLKLKTQWAQRAHGPCGRDIFGVTCSNFEDSKMRYFRDVQILTNVFVVCVSLEDVEVTRGQRMAKVASKKSASHEKLCSSNVDTTPYTGIRRQTCFLFCFWCVPVPLFHFSCTRSLMRYTNYK